MNVDGIGISAEITRQIQGGELKQGDRLPTERELAVQFRTSRGVVRKALDVLARGGHISRNVGRGTFVGISMPTAATLDVTSVSPAQLAVARQIIEPAVAANAAIHATAHDFAAMQHCLAKCDNARELADFDYWDGELHTSIATAAHNALIDFTFQTFNQVRRSAEWQKIKVFAFVHPERRAASQNDHRKIVEAIVSRDSAAARALMHEHLERIAGFIIAKP